MKTLLFTLEYPPFRGGVANYYGHLAKYWPIEEKLLVLDNNKRELIRKNYFPAWLPAYFLLRRKVRSSKVDYVLVGHILPLGTVTYFLSLFRPLKYAVIMHGMDFNYSLGRRRKMFISKKILGRADKIICANSYLADKVKDFRPDWAEKVEIVNPGVEAGIPTINEKDRFKIKKENNLKGKFILFSLGRLVERKGIDMVINSLSTLPEDIRQKIIYVIAGEGPAENYLRELVPLAWKDKIIFTGKVSEEKKWTWMDICDLFIMPAREIEGDFEGFGIVYLEANLLGKAVIAGNTGGVRDAVVDGETGILVDPLNLDDIKQSIVKLFNDEELRIRMGEAGQRRALKEFSWEKQISKINSSIKQL